MISSVFIQMGGNAAILLSHYGFGVADALLRSHPKIPCCQRIAVIPEVRPLFMVFMRPGAEVRSRAPAATA